MDTPIGPSALRVLAALANGKAYGFDIMDYTGLKSGTVYRSLSRLEELGLVDSRWEAAKTAISEKRPRRRYYELRAEGRRVLSEAQQHWLGFARELNPASRLP